MNPVAERASVANLAARWHRDLLACDPSSSAEARTAALALVVAHYGEPARHYHTIEHIAAVLATIDEVLGPPSRTGGRDAVILAGWLHDVIYDPTRHDNEAQSAAFAAAQLPALGMRPATVTETARLILLTAGHEVADDDGGGRVLIDADLAILGAAPDQYDRYAEGIRAEYAHVGDEAFADGRLAVLESFASRPRIFHTQLLHQRLDPAARANLQREIEQLRAAADR